MICPYCKPDKEIPTNDVSVHLIITIDSKGFHHVHGPLSNKPLMVSIIQRIAEEAGLVLKVSMPTGGTST